MFTEDALQIQDLSKIAASHPRQPLTIAMVMFDEAVKMAVVDVVTDHAAIVSAGRWSATTMLCRVRTHDHR
jgi:hypothetical protein